MNSTKFKKICSKQELTIGLFSGGLGLVAGSFYGGLLLKIVGGIMLMFSVKLFLTEEEKSEDKEE